MGRTRLKPARARTRLARLGTLPYSSPDHREPRRRDPSAAANPVGTSRARLRRRAGGLVHGGVAGPRGSPDQRRWGAAGARGAGARGDRGGRRTGRPAGWRRGLPASPGGAGGGRGRGRSRGREPAGCRPGRHGAGRRRHPQPGDRCGHHPGGGGAPGRRAAALPRGRLGHVAGGPARPRQAPDRGPLAGGLRRGIGPAGRGRGPAPRGSPPGLELGGQRAHAHRSGKHASHRRPRHAAAGHGRPLRQPGPGGDRGAHPLRLAPGSGGRARPALPRADGPRRRRSLQARRPHLRTLPPPPAPRRRKEPAAGSRRPHHGQKRKKARETGQRQRGQRSGSSRCDQGRRGFCLQTGQ